METPVLILTLLIIQQFVFSTVISLSSDLYDDKYENLDLYNFNNIDDNSELQETSELYNDRKTRANDRYLRFGKRFWNYELNDGQSQMPRKQRTELPETRPDQYIRLGRNKGFIPHQQRLTNKAKSANFIRFGRSTIINDEGNKKNLDVFDKSSPESSFENSQPKRRENYLRFGRNSHFLRFGRNNANDQNSVGLLLPSSILLRQIVRSGNEPLLNYYLKNVIQENLDE